MTTTDQPEPILVRWEPRYTAPIIESACPSCGKVLQRQASSWSSTVDGALTARMSCAPWSAFEEPACWRTFDVTVEVPVPEKPPLTPLTDAEHTAVTAVADAWKAICAVVGNGETRAADLSEVAAHIHALQHFVMAQAAARCYPDLYRLAGEVGAWEKTEPTEKKDT